MAYAQGTVTKIATVVRGRRHYRIRFEESEVGTGSEWSVPGLPAGPLTIISIRTHLKTAGSASTIQPELGAAASWSSEASRDHLSKQSSTAAVLVNDSTPLPIYLPEVTAGGGVGTLYGRSKPDNTATAIDTEICLVEGWL